MGLSKLLRRTPKYHAPLYSSSSENHPDALATLVPPLFGGVSLSTLILADAFKIIDVEIGPIHYFFTATCFAIPAFVLYEMHRS